MPELVVVGLALAALYLASVAIWPYAKCGRCSGRGKFTSPTGKAWRSCGRCGGAGKTERLARRLFR